MVLEHGGAIFGSFLLAPALAVFTFALTSRRIAGLAVGAITGVVLFCAGGLGGSDAWWGPQNVGVLAWTGMAVAAGDALRSRRAYVTAVEDRSRRAAETRQHEEGRRAAEERLRLSRDLHDVLAHHIAVIQVQAGVAAHLLRSQPAAAEQALAHVRGAAGEVLEELGALLGVLRQTGGEPGAPRPPSDPQPGLSRLDALVRSFAAAGLHIDSASSGAPRELPAAVDLTAYRLVQEALTNAHKHGGDRARLTLAYGPRHLAVEICNGLPPRSAEPPADTAGTGRGLLGMRERVLAVGGRLDAGPVPGDGFRVRALLPAPLSDPEAAQR